jgi:hypothetical protein
MGRREREIGYEVALRKYSETVHPGITRKELEDYLRPRNTNFSWMFTAFGGRTTTQYAALVKIGEETAARNTSGEDRDLSTGLGLSLTTAASLRQPRPDSMYDKLFVNNGRVRPLHPT